ncbi:3-isopropylmalate dehydrogenase [Cyanidiococcus yangmingshanensis]|uniref:3-isopropylmalate dehydrogenase n=1 Tax=Cyanidiococcus yangmingshanensis TaxID=2690220 RepID=A0A7J7IK68_9RHOD|nr:3-isopropylmalate dehydrogenase [Cyanidiococcus yangmingshanensis]
MTVCVPSSLSFVASCGSSCLNSRFRGSTVSVRGRSYGRRSTFGYASKTWLAANLSRHRVAVLPGDGIGPEIMNVTLEVLRRVGEHFHVEWEFAEALIGGAAIDATGDPLPMESLAICRSSEAVLLACVGGPKWDSLPNKQRPEAGLLRLRKDLEAFANLRPVRTFPQLLDASPLKRDLIAEVDLIIVRELTSDVYFGEPRGIEFIPEGNGEREAYNTMSYRESEIDRVAKVAFELAMSRPRQQLCSVDKANVLETSMLWRSRVDAMAAAYPQVQLSHMYVDNAAMQLVRQPKQFDVILTGNMFGDILSDEASMLAGSLGMLPSASLGNGTFPGIYEPIHGSAPDIAGQNRANPIACILSAALMLRYSLKRPDVADAIESAVSAVLDRGYRTADIMSHGMQQRGCIEMGEAIVETLRESLRAPVA